MQNNEGSKTVAIIGAGIAGLAAGYWLQNAGYKVIVLEAEDRAAGRAHTIKSPDNDDLVDVGTQYFHTNYKRIRRLIKECGLHHDVSKISGRTWYFDDSVNAGGFNVVHRVPYFASGSALQNIKMWASSLLRMVRYPIDPFAVLEEHPADHVLARDAFPDSFDWEYSVHGPIAIGTLEEPFEQPISYLHVIRLMRIIGMTDYLSLKNGISSLHEALAARLTVKYSSPVKALNLQEQKVVGVTLLDGTSIAADHVIVATPPEAAATLIPTDWQEERAFLTSIRRPPAIILSLFLKERLERNVWSYVFKPDRARLVNFCVDTSRKNATMTPSGVGALQAWICSPAAEEVFAQSDHVLTDAVIKELTRHFPTLTDNVQSVHIHRLSHTVPSTPVGHNRAARAFLAATDRRDSVSFCGDYLSGGYTECAVWSAERAIERIIHKS